MTIGRAVALCLRNIGGQRAGETTKSVFGQPARFGFCIGEWEERSPWPSLAERRGFAAADDVVTVHGGKGTFPMADIHNDDARDLLYLIAKSIAYPCEHVPRQRRQRRDRGRSTDRPSGSAPCSAADLTASSRSTPQPVDLWRANARWHDRHRADGGGHLVRAATRSCRSCAAGLSLRHARC
jgi:hypothetical protein